MTAPAADPTADSTSRLSLALPPPWVVLEPGRLPSTEVGQRLVPQDGSRNWAEPDLAAQLDAVLVGDDGGFAGVLLVSLVVTTAPRSQAEPGPQPRTTLLQDVELTPGRPADFAQVQYDVPVTDDVVAVLTFTTPNLPLLPVLGPMFARIAGTARVGTAP